LNVGFIGLGNMGSSMAGVTDFGPDRRSSFDRLRMSGYLFPLMVSLSNHGRDHVRVHPSMAARLQQTGFRLTVYNRSRVKADALVAAGALAATSLRDAMNDAYLVVSMMADDQAPLGLAMGEADFVDAMRRDTVHVSMSTVSPAATRSLPAVHEVRGTWLVAATVLGRPDRAASGELHIVAAGPRALDERCRALFGALSSSVHDHLLQAIARGRSEWDLAGLVEVLRERASPRSAAVDFAIS
jgi:NAD binding domain of 6-phosphogluconate dehydrogenase